VGLAVRHPSSPNPKIAVFGDIQVLTEAAPSFNPPCPRVIEYMTQWLADHMASMNIVGIVQVGDDIQLTTDGYSSNRAVAAMKIATDVGIPLYITSGNHGAFNQGYWRKNSGGAGLTMPWIGRTYAGDGGDPGPVGRQIGGYVENSWSTLAIGPVTWGVLTLEFGTRQTVLDWAKSVLRDNPGVPTIFVTHGYMCSDGYRFDWFGRGGTAQSPYSPWAYYYYPTIGTSGGVWGQYCDGELLYQNLVLPFPQIKLVFSGHDVNLAHRLTSTRPDGTRVHQIGFSHNTWLDGGPTIVFREGMFRLYEFDYSTMQIFAQTFSPACRLVQPSAANNFVLPLEI
jgi:hypothetical protein